MSTPREKDKTTHSVSTPGSEGFPVCRQIRIYYFRNNILSEFPLEALPIKARIEDAHQTRYLRGLVLIEPRTHGLRYGAY